MTTPLLIILTVFLVFLGHYPAQLFDSAGTVALGMVRRGFAHGNLPSRLGTGLLELAPPAVVRTGCHLHDLAALAHGPRDCHWTMYG